MTAYSTNLGLSIIPEADEQQDPALYKEALKLRNAMFALQAALDNLTGAIGEDPSYWSSVTPDQWIRTQNLTRVYLKASENLILGNTVNFWNNAGTLNARKANALTPNFARAFSTGNVNAGSYGEFILCGVATITGLTPGAVYFQSDSAGLISTSPGSTYTQYLGFALSTNKLYFNPQIQ
jgi:hypothetical protein